MKRFPVQLTNLQMYVKSKKSVFLQHEKRKLTNQFIKQTTS